MQKKEITCKSLHPLVYYLETEENGLFLRKAVNGSRTEPIQACCILDYISEEETESYYVKSSEPFGINTSGARITILAEKGGLQTEEYRGVPHCNILGESICLDFENGKELEEAVFQFYWKTLIPSVIERTGALEYPVRDGYVVSTLQEEVYAGTYPDVDHEFQIKGRIGMMDGFHLEVVRRMLELQLKLMREDPENAWRNPCALQPSGIREYHVRRNSMDGSANAEMFLLTGNIEIIESVWLYLAASKDWEWFIKYKKDLEEVLSLVESCIDRQGRLWSDVYYEDQVIKDGRECIAAAFAAEAMKHMAAMENEVGDKEKAEKYQRISEQLAGTLVKDSPVGFWDTEKKRFTDWVDRNSIVHDHIHLLANELPILFGYAKEEQKTAVEKLLEENFEEFQRFPSFVSARIQDYTEDEIGDGGPYDLCAAGRYWCWDFAYWAEQGREDILEQQLLKVCEQAKRDHYLMGERYDMNHVYYISEKNWHGAEKYYEYPCVFLWNLLHVYLGVKADRKADLRIEPFMKKNGRVYLDGEKQKAEYIIKDGSLTVRNLADSERTFAVRWRGKEQLLCLKANETGVL